MKKKPLVSNAVRRGLAGLLIALGAACAPPAPAPAPTPPNQAGSYPSAVTAPALAPAGYPAFAPTATPALASRLPVWGYRVAQTYPHDPGAFTQGLLFTRTAEYPHGVFYESAGLYGQSSLRVVAVETGAALKRLNLPAQDFAEGLALAGNTLWQLTWREGRAYAYEALTLAGTGVFTYTTEGWGLTFDGAALWMTDGSNLLYRRDPRTFALLDTLPVTDDLGRPVTRLNELEWVDGELWANIWQTDWVARLDPASGRVLGWVDFSGLLPADQRAGADVLNGIAYDPLTGRLWVTGKLWPSLFEVVVGPR